MLTFCDLPFCEAIFRYPDSLVSLTLSGQSKPQLAVSDAPVRFFQCVHTNQMTPTINTNSTPRWKRSKKALKRGSLFQLAPSRMPMYASA